MSNIFSQSVSPTFLKQSVNDYFISPMFMAEDIRGAITVRSDIKGTERLNMIARPSMLTKPKVAPGFNPSGSFALTSKDITVQPMALEFEQNARAFWGSIIQQLLASGYKEDDVEQMKSPDIWNKVMLPIIAQAGQQDLIRQMFFGNPLAEVYALGKPTGVIDTNYSGYTGFLTHFMNASLAYTIPAGQQVAIASSSAAVKQESIWTLTYGATTTSYEITINGVSYAQAYATSAIATATAWLTTNKAAVEARLGVEGVIVTNPANGAIKIVSKLKGGAFSSSCTVTGGGSVAESGVVAVAKAGALSANEADSTLEDMMDAITPEMNEFDLVFYMTQSMWRNLIHTMKNRATPLGDMVYGAGGIKVPSYEGIPIIVRPDWDKWIAAGNGSLKPHRALLTTPQNLIFATDGTNDSEMIETWYNEEAQMRRYRVQYKAQTAYLHKELIVLAGFND